MLSIVVKVLKNCGQDNLMFKINSTYTHYK